MHEIEIIAEIGINHQGDMELAKAMIHAAKKCGADTAKFQVYSPEVVLDRNHPLLKDHWDLILRTELLYNRVRQLKWACQQVGIRFLASVFEPKKVDWLEDLGVDRYKIASRSVYDDELLEAIGKTGKPVLASISELYKKDVPPPFQEHGINPTLLYCVSEYPAPLEHCDLSVERFRRFRGFSDHTQGYAASVLAMVYGARIIEKHFTMDRSLPGPDHICSIEPAELEQLCRIRDEMEVLLGY